LCSRGGRERDIAAGAADYAAGAAEGAGPALRHLCSRFKLIILLGD